MADAGKQEKQETSQLYLGASWDAASFPGGITASFPGRSTQHKNLELNSIHQKHNRIDGTDIRAE